MTENLLEVAAPYWTQGEHNENWPLNRGSLAYATSLVVKTGPGKLYGFTAYNSGAAQFIILFDGTSVPANGATGVPFAVGATSNLGVAYGDTGRAFNAGCVLALSTTSPTLTLGAAEAFFDAQYV